MRTDVVVEIDACTEHVWAVLADVSRWPAWTTAVREVRLLDGPLLGKSSVVRVRAAGLPERTWRVTDYARHRGFTWTADGVGARARIAFRLRRLPAEDPGGRERTRLTVEHERLGWVAGLVARATERTTQRHLAALVEGLRLRCEQRRAVDPAT